MTALGILVLLVILAIAGLKLWRPSPSLDDHIAAAMRAANGPCRCGDHSKAGWLHSPVRCVPPSPPCACGGRLRDASGVVHSRAVGGYCSPVRECIGRGVSS